MGPKKFLGKNRIDKNLVPTKILSEKMFGPKKFCIQRNFLVQNNFGSKKKSVQKDFWAQNKFWDQNLFFGSTEVLGLKKLA